MEGKDGARSNRAAWVACCSIALLIIILSLLLKLGRNWSGNSPLQFDSVSFDEGVVQDPAPVKHQFTFKNTSSQTIELGKLITSCSCVVAAPTGTSYGPGSTGTIEVTMKLKSLGVNTQRVTVPTKTPGRPITLQISANYRPVGEAHAVPSAVNLSSVTDASMQIVVVTGSAIPVAVEKAISRSGLVHAEVIGTEHPLLRGVQGMYEVDFRLKLSKEAPDGFTSDSDLLEVNFDPPQIPAITIPVSLSPNASNVQIVPHRIVFVFSKKRPSPIAQRVAFHSKDGGSISIRDVINPVRSYLHVSEILSKGEPTEASLVATTDAYPADGPRDATVEVKIETSKGTETLDLPVSFREIDLN